MIAVVTLIWNLLGAANFLVQMNPVMLEAYRESERAIVEARPAWATAAFALGVFAGAFGSVLLLLRKAAAFPFFLASFAGVAGTLIHSIGAGIEFGMGEILGIVLMPLLVAVFLVLYSWFATRVGWLRR